MSHQIRMFTGHEGETGRMTDEINAWLKQTKVRVVNVFGNIAPQSALEKPSAGKLAGAESGPGRRFAPSDIFLVVVYDE